MDKSKLKQINKRVTFSEGCGSINPEYKNLSARVNTFAKRSWPPSIPQTPQTLAEAGFYYTGKLIR